MRSSARLFVACITIVVLGGQPPSSVSASASEAPGECGQLVSLKLPDVRVTEAVAVPAAATGALRVAHCRVNGVVGKETRFTLLLPDTWNQKFMMGGGGGFVAGIDNQARGSLNAGYATVGTDTGHQAGMTIASWALNDLERQLNFGHLAVHRVAEVSKAIIRSHYGSDQTRSYFNGCSNGGRQALMEAQRYPDDFDGILAGAPAYDFLGIGAQFIKDMQAAYPDSRALSTAPFSSETLKSVESQIVDKCDAIDGAKDGLIEDPRQCQVDVAALSGISDAQKATLKKIYGETRSKDGLIFPGQPVGGEGDAQGWPSWIIGPNPLVAMQRAPSLRYAFGTIKYYEQVEARDPNVRDFARMFMLPGVLHCAGGPGPDTVDWASVIDDWVVKGQAPERVMARKMAAEGAVSRTRPLCLYPQRAVYNGTGSLDDEKSFSCSTAASRPAAAP